MNKNILIAVLLSAIAVAALLLSVRLHPTAESMIGFAAVVGILYWVMVGMQKRAKR